MSYELDIILAENMTLLYVCHKVIIMGALWLGVGKIKQSKQAWFSIPQFSTGLFLNHSFFFFKTAIESIKYQEIYMEEILKFEPMLVSENHCSLLGAEYAPV